MRKKNKDKKKGMKRKTSEMGKKNKDKKKGMGAEKTAAKTDKKLTTKMKKELQKIGEDDIETMIAQIEEQEKKRLAVTETVVEPPSRRINFSFIAHPDQQQLILYGGEFFDGQKTFIYNDLFFYNIPANTWTLVKAPPGPAPRCGHQMVATSAQKGQLWVFGGEYASPTQNQFYHYRDLWVYHVGAKRWQKMKSAGGPSGRSGHRMVLSKKNLIVFGGYHDNLRDYKYFNDVWCFDTETYTWKELKPSGSAPAPRSGCCMVALNDGRILVYGGYSKERIKKDVDKGRVFTDAFLLIPDKNDTTGTKWKWQQTKLGGAHFSPRCSMPITVSSNNTAAYCFGGVFDTENDEEDMAGNFYNDFFQLDLERLAWKTVTLSGKREIKKKEKQTTDEAGADNEKENDMDVQEIQQSVETTTISDDGVFKITVGPSTSSSSQQKSSLSTQAGTQLCQPCPRINCGLAIKRGQLYLYGGMFEDEGDREVSLCDFYSVDLKKLDEWKTIISDDISSLKWLGSDSESSDGEEEEEEGGSGSDEDSEDQEESSEEKSSMETD